MACKSIDNKEKGRMEFALALGKVLQKHDFKKSSPMTEDITRMVRSAFLREVISEQDAKMLIQKAMDLCTADSSDESQKKSVSRSLTLQRGDETDVYGHVFRFNGDLEIISGATGHVEHSIRPKTGKEHVFTDNDSNREIRVVFQNVFHASIDVDLTVGQIEATPAAGKKSTDPDAGNHATEDGYRTLGEQDLIRRLREGLESRVDDDIPLTHEEKKPVEGNDTSHDLCMAGATDRLEAKVRVGESMKVGRYSVTVTRTNGKSATLNIRDENGKVIASGKELDVGIETTIAIPSEGEEIIIRFHEVRDPFIDITLIVSDIPCSARAALPKSQTVTINRGDQAVMDGYRFYYRSDSGHSSRMQVIRHSTGIPLDDFTPKSDRKVVIDDDKESKRITIEPKVVYVTSVVLEISIEVVQKSSTGSG
jgi:hypothetical protein